MSKGERVTKETYEPEKDCSLAMAVVEAIAKYKQTDPDDMGAFSEQTTVESVKRWFDSETTTEDSFIIFPTYDCTVSITGTGQILVGDTIDDVKPH